MSNTRDFKLLQVQRFNDEHRATATSDEQKTVEDSIGTLFDIFSKRLEVNPEAPVLLRRKHSTFLSNSLTHVPTAYQCLDSSRPWLCYWILHSLALLDEEESLMPDDVSKIAKFLARCQCPDGGFGGGPGQAAHLAPTYAAVNALCILGTKEAFHIINRKTLLNFLWAVRSPDGAFHMHVGGEVDIRGLYCALNVAKLTNIYSDALFDRSAEWIVSCQTYEGGFSGTPGMEAHGGYAFCGLAALTMLGKELYCDIKGLLRWMVNRQMRFEGGFQGRTNKLVDGCYSFWQGGAFPIMHKILDSSDSKIMNMDRWLFQQEALQEYVLICCQNSSGGLIDKPSKPRDIYHTCYALSGLSVAQRAPIGPVHLVGSPDNELAPVHPVHNIGIDAVVNAYMHFSQLPIPLKEAS